MNSVRMIVEESIHVEGKEGARPRDGRTPSSERYLLDFDFRARLAELGSDLISLFS
jgi:hypothetical protein